MFISNVFHKSFKRKYHIIYKTKILRPVLPVKNTRKNTKNNNYETCMYVMRACASMRGAEFRLREPETEMVVGEVLARQSLVSLQFPLE